MRWPDAIEAMAQKVKAHLESNDKYIPVFLGAYAGVPNVDTVYIWRDKELPANNGLCGSASMLVCIDMWTYAGRTERKETELDTVNSQVLAAWRKHDELAQLIRSLTFEDVGVYAVFKRTNPDNGEYYPMIGTFVEFTVNYDNEG